MTRLMLCSYTNVELLGQLLPVMVVDKVPSSDNFGQILRLTGDFDILMTPKLTEDVVNLATLIY